MASVFIRGSGKEEHYSLVWVFANSFSEAEGNVVWEDCTCFATTAASWFCLQYNFGVPLGVTSSGLPFLCHTCIGSLDSKHSPRSLCSEDYSFVGQASSHGPPVGQRSRVAVFYMEPAAAQWTQAAVTTFLTAELSAKKVEFVKQQQLFLKWPGQGQESREAFASHIKGFPRVR